MDLFFPPPSPSPSSLSLFDPLKLTYPLFQFFHSSSSSLLVFDLRHKVMGIAATDAKFHVLAVDDSVIDRKLIERLLKTSSYQVTAVDSGSKALKFLGLLEDEQRDEISSTSVSLNTHSHSHSHEIEVNLIITDYCMPGMTGYDLLRKIKESTSLKDIPVVIMSSENEPSRINRCLEEGAEEFFLKPVKLSDLRKLRPHLLKGRGKGEQQPNSNKTTNSMEESPSHTTQIY